MLIGQIEARSSIKKSGRPNQASALLPPGPYPAHQAYQAYEAYVLGHAARYYGRNLLTSSIQLAQLPGYHGRTTVPSSILQLPFATGHIYLALFSSPGACICTVDIKYTLSKNTHRSARVPSTFGRTACQLNHCANFGGAFTNEIAPRPAKPNRLMWWFTRRYSIKAGRRTLPHREPA